jgi:hypothetical protein
MGSLGIEPSLDVVSPEVAGAFVSGLQRAFFLMGGLLVLGVAIVIVRGERPAQLPLADERVRVAGPGPVRE